MNRKILAAVFVVLLVVIACAGFGSSKNKSHRNYHEAIGEINCLRSCNIVFSECQYERCRETDSVFCTTCAMDRVNCKEKCAESD